MQALHERVASPVAEEDLLPPGGENACEGERPFQARLPLEPIMRQTRIRVA